MIPPCETARLVANPLPDDGPAETHALCNAFEVGRGLAEAQLTIEDGRLELDSCIDALLAVARQALPVVARAAAANMAVSG